MKRRALTMQLGAVALGPVIARGQTAGRSRRIGVFMDVPAGDARAQPRLAAFLQGLQEAGWSVGRNVRIDYRWRPVEAQDWRAGARELIGLAPDVILGSSTPVIAALQRETRSLPIVFATVIDPIGAGFVESFARPGGNMTGFTSIDFDLGGKWVEILKEVDPRLRRVAVLSDPSLPSTVGQLKAIEAGAVALHLALTTIDVRDATEIERALVAFARTPNGGIVVTAASATGAHREHIIALAARHRLPAVYPYDHFAVAGGLIAYGPDLVLPFRSAAGYVGRILKGARPADLPVQAPTTLEMIVNLATAKALGLTIPQTILLRADEVIE